MARTLSLNNLYEKKYKTFPFTGVWNDTIGKPEQVGAWLIYGAEKNGKTWFSLKMAEYISQFEKTLYISAEEGTSKTFQDTCLRAKLDHTNKNLNVIEYESIEELNERLKKRRAPKVVFIDNVTIYQDELKNGAFRKMLKDHKNKLLVFIAHEERNEPYGATGKLIKKLSKVIVRVQGLKCFVSGRCQGGTLIIDEDKSTLYHGT